MRALIVNDQPDCAGVGYRYAHAARLQGIDCRSIAFGVNEYAYRQDLLFGDDVDLADFDVYLLSNSTPECVRLLGFEPKRAAVLYHGSDIRYSQKYPHMNKSLFEYGRERGWKAYVTTLDLEVACPEAQWLPCVAPVGPKLEVHDGFVVSHAPARNARGRKGTKHLLAASTLDGFQVDLIEGVPNWKALKRKAGSDVFFDQIQWGFGVNSLEAFSMGLPVITGSHHQGVNEHIRSRIPIPYWEAHDLESLRGGVRALRCPETAQEYAGKGKAYAAEFHSLEAVGRAIVGLVERIA